MAYPEVMTVLQKANAPMDGAQPAPNHLSLGNSWGMELVFENGSVDASRAALVQISVNEERYRWGTQKIIGQPLHRALRVLADVSTGASWRPEDAALQALEDLRPLKRGEWSNETLLTEGTVWLPAAGLALVMTEGAVSDLVWRRVSEVPREFIGPVTPEQLELSARSDLPEHLLAQTRQRQVARQPTPRRNALEGALAAVFILAMGWIAWHGWREMKVWQDAAILPGTLQGIEAPTTAKPLYHVEYKDPTGRSQTVTLERADFYVAPTGAGDSVEVVYVDSDPPRVKGLPRAKDSAFLTYLPWAIGVALAYTVLKLALGWFSGRRRGVPGGAGSSM
jgi:hypothetical protein